MLLDRSLPNHFLAEVVRNACHILNECLIRPILKKTPYELQRGKKSNISYFHPFGFKCFIHSNGKNNLGKFYLRSDEGIFLGYARTGRDFRVFNQRNLSNEESVHVIFDYTNPKVREVKVSDDEITSLRTTENTEAVNCETNAEKSTIAVVESTTPADKTNILREWNTNAVIPKFYSLET